MPISPHKIAFILLLAALAPSLAACGRRGPLEPPPGAAVACAPVSGAPGATQTAANGGELPGQTATNSYSQPVSSAPAACATAHSQKTFFLDPLL